MDESEYPRASHSFMYIEHSITPAVLTVDGNEIRDNVRRLFHTTCRTTNPLILSCRYFTNG